MSQFDFAIKQIGITEVYYMTTSWSDRPDVLVSNDHCEAV